MNSLIKLLSSSAALFAAICLTSAATCANAQSLKPHHQALSGNCAACHGSEGKLLVPQDQACQTCHGSYAELAKKTAERQKADQKPEPNPHTSGHYGETLNCTACHTEHKPATEVYCNHCHDFSYPRMKK